MTNYTLIAYKPSSSFDHSTSWYSSQTLMRHSRCDIIECAGFGELIEKCGKFLFENEFIEEEREKECVITILFDGVRDHELSNQVAALAHTNIAHSIEERRKEIALAEEQEREEEERNKRDEKLKQLRQLEQELGVSSHIQT